MDILDIEAIDWDGLPGRLRAAIATRGISQRSFADAAGVTVQAATKWLGGGRIAVERWSSVAAAAGLSVPELLGVPKVPEGARPPDAEATDILRRLAALSNRRLDRAVPDLMQVLSDAQRYAESHGD